MRFIVSLLIAVISLSPTIAARKTTVTYEGGNATFPAIHTSHNGGSFIFKEGNEKLSSIGKHTFRNFFDAIRDSFRDSGAILGEEKCNKDGDCTIDTRFDGHDVELSLTYYAYECIVRINIKHHK